MEFETPRASQITIVGCVDGDLGIPTIDLH